MKPLQLFATLATLLICLSVFSWIISKTAPPRKDLVGSKFNRPDPSLAEEEEEDDTDKDHYKKNPFPAATGSELPVAELVETTYQFGRMGLGKVGEHNFVLKNTGNAPLKIAKGPTQCKCTVAGLKDQEIPPGGEATIHLAWEPKSPGPFAQTATLWTNDPKNPELTIGVEGDMFQEIEVQPLEGWKLGVLTSSKPTPIRGIIQSAVIENFEITKIETSSDRVTLKETKLTPEELQGEEISLRSGYRLEGELAAISEPGNVEESVTIHTNLEEYPKFVLPLSARRAGALTVIGPQWTAGGPRLDLGKISSEKGKETKLTVMIPPADEEFKILETISNPAFVQATLKPERTGKELAQERYSLFFTVPPGSPKGIWGAGREGKITLKTNHPQVRDIDITLYVEVE